MTLHEAIELVLIEAEGSLTSGEIAKRVNEKGLYSRRDKRPIRASQISARVNNYPHIFSIEDGTITLVQDDTVSLKVQKFKNEFSLRQGGSSYYYNFFDSLNSLLDNYDDESSDHNIVKEPSTQYGAKTYSNQERHKMAYEIFEWYLTQNSNFDVKVSDAFSTFLSKLHWFYEGNHKVTYHSYMSNHFLLKIASQNPDAHFVLINQEIQEQSTRNEEIKDYVKSFFPNKAVGDEFNSTGIIIPPFLRGKEWNGVVGNILAELNFDKPKFDKAILVLPANILINKTKGDAEFKRTMVESGYLETVVLFSSGMLDHAGVIISVLLFDFSKRKDQIFLVDASEIPTNKAAELVNQKEILQNISSFIPYEEIKTENWNLNPAHYVIEILPDYGKEVYTIDSLISESIKNGISIPRRKLYEEGELKIVRTTEIKEDVDYLDSSQLILGVDYDEIRNPQKFLVNRGIVLSGFNKKLKGNKLSNSEQVIIGSDVFWLMLKENLILDEYFLQEIRKDYVQKQVAQFSKGSAIMRLNFNDLMKIKIKVPALVEQKDSLLQDLKDQSSENQKKSYQASLDFINTLEHSLRQPASSLGNDLLSLRDFINNKINLKETLNFDEPVVPIFDTDTPEQIAIHSLSNTLERMHRMLTDIEYILTQAGSLAKAKASPIMELIELQPFLNNFISENQDIKIVISGNAEIIADRKQLRILFNNLIANAKKHGFQNQIASPTIWIEVNSKDQFGTHIYVRNNGKPLPKEFTTEQFLAKGRSTDEAVGSGFGGFLIGQILKNHNGSIELIQRDFSLMPYKVEFKITLPK